MQHLEEGTVHAWLDGALSTTEAREVEQHIAECSECSAIVAEARGLIAGASRIVSSLDVVRGNVIPKKPAAGAGRSLWHSLHLTPARAALAATVMIAFSTLLTLKHDTSEKLVPPAVSLDRSSVAPASSAPPANIAEAPAFASSTPRPDSVVASAALAKEAQLKDREVGRKEKDEAKTDLAAGVMGERAVADARAKAAPDSIRVDAAKPSVVAAAPPAVSPPTAAVGGASASSLDTNLKKGLVKLGAVDSVRSAEQFRQSFARSPLARNEALARGIACFQFAEPQPRGLPQRFALQSFVQDTARRIVRAVNENGRIDTVLAGSSWTRSTPSEITVRFASDDRPLTLPIRDAAFGAASVETRQEAARRAGLSVSQVNCRP